MATDGCADHVSPAYRPESQALAWAAALVNGWGDAVPNTVDLPVALKGWQEPVEEVDSTCRIKLRVTFFFDGTGNNRDADEPLNKSSNVARLFRAHPPTREAGGIYRFYIPGVGTYFPEIGDRGGKLGLAMGKGGEARLDWAMRQLEKIINKHPPDNTLVELRLSAFGFSRGATEARAFANRVQARCEHVGGRWHWKWRKPLPVHFSFLGLFDTVASVGLVDTVSIPDALAVATGFGNLDLALAARRRGKNTRLWDGTPAGRLFSAVTRAAGQGTGLESLAFGDPGANPAASSLAHGHSAWGDSIAIPDVVEKCVHFVAMHEQRNSFPCDLVRVDDVYPANCEEYVYPGVHSDVGGGYAAGEQGRSADDAQKLSQLPLLHMHAVAIEHGVPLQGVHEITQPEYKMFFQMAPILHKRWNHYMQTAGSGGRPLGQMVLAHTRLWYQWRFHRIRAYLQAIEGTNSGDTLPEEDVIRAAEARFDEQRAKAQQRLDEAKAARDDARSRMAYAWGALDEANTFRRRGLPNDAAAKQAAYDAARDEVERYEQRHNRARAELDAVPGSGAAQAIRTYDLNLLRGVKMLQKLVDEKGDEHLRPHYRMVLGAYEAEFAGRGLTDPDIIAFFNDYVHDSLAGFAKDLTLPSDPRVFYVGANDIVRYAGSDMPDAPPNAETAQAGRPSAETA